MNQPPPYGQPPHQGPPVQPFAAPPYPPPNRGPGIFGVIGVLRFIALGVAILMGGAIAIFAFVMARKQGRPHVVIENATSAALDVSVDGKSIGTIAAEGAEVVQLSAGAHEVKAGSDSGKITVPDTSGYRGLYAIGGRSHLAVVTVYYSVSPTLSGPEDKVEPVRFTAGSRLAPLPLSMSLDSMAPDKPFVDSVEIPQGSNETSVTHLCHVHDRDDDFVGCPGYHTK